MPPTAIEVRIASHEEWATVRDLRLGALKDDPVNFWAIYEDEAGKDETFWRDRTRSRGWFVAYRDGAPVGIAAVVDEDYLDAGTREVVSMWVVPEARRAGMGAVLLEAIKEWAIASGLQRLQLDVTSGNDIAERLYLKIGFRFTGNTHPHPRLEGKTERQMILDLGRG